MAKKEDLKCEVLGVAAPQAGGEIRRDLPAMIWDGGCAFCARWIRRWRKLTRDKIQYAPFQSFVLLRDRRLKEFPHLTLDDCEESVKLVMPDGTIYSSAEAVFRALDYAGRQKFWLRFYKKFPGFRWIAEAAYRFVAARRRAMFRLEDAAIIFPYAFALNFGWEILHSYLYISNITVNFWLCLFLAAAADGLIISALFFFFRRTWLFAAAALAAALVIEKAALFYGFWLYNPAMPIVPLLGVGLTPFVQLAATGLIARRIAKIK